MAETLTSLPSGFQVDTLPQGFVIDGQRPEPDHAKANEALAKSLALAKSSATTVADVASGYAPIETALNLTSGIVLGFPAYLGGGIGTLAARALGIGDPDEDPKEVAKRYSEAVTYQPMTEAGKRLTAAATLPLTDLMAGSEVAGHKVADVTGSPGAGALTEATIQMLPAVLLGSLGRKTAGKAPTGESINETATAIIGTADEAAVAHVADKLQTVYEKTGIDPPAVFKSNRTNPTVLQDLASSNVEVPKAIEEELPKETLEQFSERSGSEIGGVSHLQGIVEKLQKVYIQQGIEAGKAMLEDMAANAPESSGFSKEVATKGFLSDLDAELTNRAQEFKRETEQPVGYWQGPEGTADIEPTFYKPTMAERLKENMLNDRNWHATEEVSAKDILEQGKAAIAAGKTPEAALGEITPPPPQPPKKPPTTEEGPRRSEAEKTILSKINTDEQVGKKWTFDKLYTELIDRFNPIKTMEKEAAGGKRLPTGESPYDLQRLTAGTFGKGDQFLNYGTRDFDTYKTNGPSYREALSSVRDDLDGFRAYMASRRAVELEGRGIESGFDLEAAKQVVKDGNAKFEDAFQKRLKYRDALVDYAVKSGLVSEEGATAMREANKAYVPFYRYFEEESRPASGNQPRNPIKRIKGSEREIIDPIVSDVKDTFLFISLAEKNAARQAFANMGEEFAKPVKSAMRPVDITDEVTRALKDQGIEADEESFAAFRPQSYNLSSDQIAVFEGGKRKVYEVDPEVARAFNATDAGSASILASMLRGAASWLRAGVTLSPDFIMRNPVRDALSAFVYTGSHPIKTVKGAISLWSKDEAFQRWQMGGGANATMVAVDRNYIGKELFDLNEKTGFMNATWNYAKSPLEVLRIASEIMENVTRLGSVRDEMLQAKDKAQVQALSLIAREATVDFARHGADPFFQQWQRSTAFMNPAIQGIDLMFRAMKEDPKGTFAKAFAAITVPSVLLWWSNHDDSRWKDIPNWERDMFWIVMTPTHIYRVPKPFELGVLFGSVPERVLDAYVDDKPDAFKQFGKTMVNVFGFNVIPTVGIPPLEQMTNYSMFTDRPLIPGSMEKWLPEYQFTPYTTQTTRALGHLVGQLPNMHDSSFASPLVIDNYIRGWSGTLGTYAVQIADFALRKTGALPDPIRPASTLADIPGVKAFVVRYPSSNAQSIQDFHDNYNKETKVITTVKHLALTDPAAALREAQIDPASLVRLDSIHTALQNAQTMIQAVDKNPVMLADEKRQLIDSVYMQMIQMSTAGNTTIQEIKKAMKVKPVIVPAPETIQ